MVAVGVLGMGETGATVGDRAMVVPPRTILTGLLVGAQMMGVPDGRKRPAELPLVQGFDLR